jgi:hypothetical protein
MKYLLIYDLSISLRAFPEASIIISLFDVKSMGVDSKKRRRNMYSQHKK